MSVLNALILGIVEGLTEFLPISSTAHLIFVSKLLKIHQTEFQKFFEVFIQSGAILAVLIIYFRHLLTHKKNLKNIVVSFFPTAIIGFVFYKIIKNIFFESYLLIVFMMFFVGFVFFTVELLVKRKKLRLQKSVNNITYKQAIIIGLGQSLAIVPGVSRAGAVIVTMMFLGFRRDEAALYSFLLAVPTIFAASAFDLLKTNFSLVFNSQNLFFLIIGFLTSFISAFFVIRLFINYLQKNSLVVFGWYRIIVAGILILAFLN